jgi:prevent-host-death family protein
MKFVTTHAAKTTLSKLIERVQTGEEIIIARGAIPVAKLVALDHAAPKREFGALRGKLVVPPSFFEPLPADELAEWEG